MRSWTMEPEVNRQADVGRPQEFFGQKEGGIEEIRYYSAARKTYESDFNRHLAQTGARVIC